MAGVAVVNAIIFGVYGQMQRKLSDPEHLCSHFLAGALAGLAQAPVASPLELAKVRLQLQESAGSRYAGPIECLSHAYRTRGIRGVFNGLGITGIREAPSLGFYFLTYEALTRSSSIAEISTFHILMAGGLAGTASWVSTYPIDVVKSRIQADDTGRYSGALDCLRKSINTEGYKWLFRGLNSTIIRAFPTNAATFAVVTWTFRIFGDEVQETHEKKIETLKKSDDHNVRREPENIHRKLHETYVDNCNNFFVNFMGEYTYESRSYVSTSMTPIAMNDAARIIAKSGNDFKRFKVDIDHDENNENNTETLTTEEIENIVRQQRRPDKGG